MAKPWFPWFWGDYVADTAMLSLTEHGAYLKLLGNLYTSERPLPADWTALYRICGAHGDLEEAAVRSVTDRFFERDIEGLVQRRAMEEIQKRRHITDRNTRIARERHQTGTKTAPDTAPELNQDATSTSTSTSTSKSTPTQDNTGRQGGRFTDFWKAYPKKVKRKTSEQVWKLKNLDGMADKLIEDVAVRLDEDYRWKQGFIPDPTTYLRQERWADEISTAPERRK